ncbi:Putative 115 kDa protein in type-1 retrotransposable element R1DM [Eumeta japonica]|uniref:115 kDa protein in type-1 retrotransposable element R1DM n=1 Tax=Eumeta variegata TaxID=151549 RepID=A0A4C2A9D3_EUMVA|nr:Putative 115 kDa protein in type-1 retrotransposable element R1DM [Eumeta japonica]
MWGCNGARSGTSLLSHSARTVWATDTLGASAKKHLRSVPIAGGTTSVQGGVLLAAGALDSHARTELAEGLSAEENTDHVSLRFIQSNLQSSKLATSELLVEADRRRIAVALVQEPYVGSIGELRRYPGCRVVQKATPRRGPVKAAIIVLDSGVDVEEDQTLIDENVTAAVIVAGNCRIGVVSVYFEGDMPIGPYLDRVRYVCSKLGTDKIILGGDVNAWSVWWGSEHDDARGVDLCDFFDAEGLHILNEGNTPTFEVYRGDRLFRSVVDVTACGSALLDRVEEWQVVRDVTSSDHNAVTFAVRMGKRSGPRPHRYTGLQYSKGSMVRVRSSHGCCSR